MEVIKGQTEAIKTETIKTETIKTETIKTETTKTETIKMKTIRMVGKEPSNQCIFLLLKNILELHAKEIQNAIVIMKWFILIM